MKLINVLNLIFLFSFAALFGQNYTQPHHCFSNSGLDSNNIPSGGSYENFFVLGEPCVKFGLAGGVYSGCVGFLCNVDTTVGISNCNIPVLKTTISQNYPNPFNPETTINYSIKENSNVQIEIYNIKGQKVKALIDDFRDAGYHQVMWNGTDNQNKPVSSGLYFYKMKVCNYQNFKKMILIK